MRYKCTNCKKEYTNAMPTSCYCSNSTFDIMNEWGGVNKNSYKVDGNAQRFNGGKLRMDLVPVSSINALARVLTYGAEKYDADNWRRGFKYSTPYGCLMRHLTAWQDGEDIDPESGLSHLDHAIANIAMLIEFERECPHLDDRWSTRCKQEQGKNDGEKEKSN
jgi:hypothetical protein